MPPQSRTFRQNFGDLSYIHYACRGSNLDKFLFHGIKIFKDDFEVRMEFGKSYIDVLLREAKYNDPKGLVKDITSFEWGYKGRVKIKSASEVADVFNLIKQSYEQTL